MSYEYTGRRRGKPAEKTGGAPPQPSIDALRSGAAAPTREQMGHRVDLPEAMREKMETAFGADLSAVKLYESEAVAEAGANAVTRGADIAFAPGMLDFTSYGGQALLGHELSHVVSQARGEVAGGGYLEDYSLEARADREGAMAAAGQTVSMPSAPMSAVSAASAAGPMQANKLTHKLAIWNNNKMHKSMQQADAAREGGDLEAMRKHNVKAWKQGTWSNYFNNLSESRGQRRFDAEMESFLQGYDKPMYGLPIFHKAYYNVPKTFNDGKNHDDPFTEFPFEDDGLDDDDENEFRLS